MHAAGAGIVWDSLPSSPAQQRYALAAHFIGYAEGDMYGDMSARTAESWPSLYGVNLGRPLGPRGFDGDARFTRAFEGGQVILDAGTKVGSIPGF